MQVEHGLEQLTSAVFTLAESRETLQQRLISACVGDIHNINAETDLPLEMREKFGALCQRLHCRPAVDAHSSGSATIPATISETISEAISAMNDDEARRHIETIGQMFRELSEYLAKRP